MDTEEIDVSEKIQYAIKDQTISLVLKTKRQLKTIKGVLVLHDKNGSRAFEINLKNEIRK